MSSIDNRVVEMTFNNAEFERRISQTLKSLEQLKANLDFNGAKRGLADFGAAANKFSVGNLGAAVEGVSKRFLALGTIAVTTLATITSHAITAGTQMLRSFTLNPILDGFREYETNINSIQTILSNTQAKGTTLDQVNAALDELNKYADQTIYNFSEMTRNIGTFTAAGVDLDTSVNAIKGIANLAAISGSNSQQASTAMYQLSQAIASGTVRLMDWNSVVNAGMGGEVFQTALFETGKALGTLTNVPLSQTFEEWKNSGNSFRSSLESGWLTSEVLTTTLQAFTGDLSEAQLMALGYTQQQAAEMIKLGVNGKEAATKVKTLTQLLGTVKEAVGSGWATSFRILFGDFNQAKNLFSTLSDTIGKFISKNTEARNSMLAGWAWLGGRDKLVEGLSNAFKALFKIIQPIRDAFRDVFPKMTTLRLLELTDRFKAFTERLFISGETARKLRVIFNGIFSVFKIGWEIVKNAARAFGELFDALVIDNSGPVVDFLIDLAQSAITLKKVLVDDGGIRRFFDSLVNFIQNPIPYLKDLKENILDFFSGNGVDFGVFEGVFQRLEDRFRGLKTITEKLSNAWDWLKNALGPVSETLDNVFTAISDWFSELGQSLADEMDTSDFDPVFDALNVGLLGGIALLIKKFIDNGLKLDFGSGIFDKIGGLLDTLTDKLKLMQTDIKANILLKIAGAVALLTASVLILSTIDSVALTKALTAMAVGFGQLVGSMQLLNSAGTNITGGATLTIIATGMIAMAAAVLILAGAAKVLASMDWNDLSKGMAAITLLTGTLVGSARLLNGSGLSLTAASVGMIAMATAMNILAVAVLQFGAMDWEEIGKGLAAIAVGLGAIVIAMNKMPTSGMIGAGTALIGVAFALNIMALAVLQFGAMDWEEIGKGMAGFGAGLLIIVLALRKMPKGMMAISAGLVLVGVALNLIALAVRSMGSLDWEELGKGIGGLGVSLAGLAFALTKMSASIPGSIALGLAAAALLLMAKVIKEYGKLKFTDMLKGLGGVAATLAILAGAAALLSPAIGAMLGLGIALVALGAGFALFGAGAWLVATAFGIIAKAGEAGLDILFQLIDGLIERLPDLIKAVAKGLVELAKVFADAAPTLIKAFAVILSELMEALIELAPQFGETIVVLIHTLLEAARETFPDIVATGFELLLEFLRGVRDNIGEVTTLAGEIIVNFLDGITEKLPDIVTAAVDLLTTFLEEIGNHVEEIISAGVQLITDLLTGIADSIDDVTAAALDILEAFLTGITDSFGEVIEAGADIVVKLVEGIGNNLLEIAEAVTDIVTTFLDALDDHLLDIIQAGWDFLINFIEGLAQSIEDNMPRLRQAGIDLAVAIIDGFTFGLLGGVGKVMGALSDAFLTPLEWVGDQILGSEFVSGNIANAVVAKANGVLKGAKSDSGDTRSTKELESISRSTGRIQRSLEAMEGLDPVITPVLDLTEVEREAGNIQKILAPRSIRPGESFQTAQTIAQETVPSEVVPETSVPQATRDVHFTQINNAPKQLSTADIYRRTKNQIDLAKKELAIV